MVDLVTVGKARLDRAAAASYQRGLNAGGGGGVTSSFRDPAEQSALRVRYLAGNYPAYVAPVEKSDHVKGLAIDLPPADRDWWRANGREYGWVFTDPTESWHMAYRIAYDRHLNDPVTLVKPNTVEESDAKMIVLARLKDQYKDGRVWVGDGVIRRHIPNEGELSNLQYQIKMGTLRAKTAEVLVVDSLDFLGQVI